LDEGDVDASCFAMIDWAATASASMVSETRPQSCTPAVWAAVRCGGRAAAAAVMYVKAACKATVRTSNGQLELRYSFQMRA
jgi:hypothetical protein